MIRHRSLQGAFAGALALALAACATTRPGGAPPSVTEATRPAPTAPRTPAKPVAQTAPEPAVERSPWERLRTRRAMPGCDYSDEVERQARLYTRNPARFAATWEPAMPFLLLVLDEVERRDLPGELALLPYVESHYQPTAGESRRPYGMWQLMPDTARGRGLVIANDYDARLDAIESTRAALELLERYDREFGDWRLGMMAFNAGEYRVKRELRKHKDAAVDAEHLRRLGVSAVTHDHLAKLLALGCIVADPARFDVELPEPSESDRLAVVDTPHVDLRIAARLAGIPLETMRRFNAGQRRTRMSDAGPARLVMPATQVRVFEEKIASLPVPARRDWRSQRVEAPTTLAALAGSTTVAAAVLAAANGLEPEASVDAGAHVLLPGQEAVVAEATPATRIHVIAKGDTLSGVARRYALRVADLLQWNGLRANSVLRIGMRLRLNAPGT